MAITAAALRMHTDFPTETRIMRGRVTVLQPRVQDESAVFLASSYSLKSRKGQHSLQMIERSAHRITITRGGSHGQTQRLERGLRSRSPFRRHVALFCADLLHAQRCAFLGLV